MTLPGAKKLPPDVGPGMYGCAYVEVSLLHRSLVTEERAMKKSKFSEEQIAYALRQADGGTPVGDEG